MQVPRHRAPGRYQPRRRIYLALTASLLAIVGVLGGAYLLGYGGGQAAPPAAAAHVSGAVTCSAGPSTVCASGSTQSSGGSSSAAPPRHSVTPSPTASRHRSPRPTPSPTTGGVASPAPSTTGSGADSSAPDSVLALINQARAQAGLPAYTISAGLETSSARHNQLMAGGCGLSHQCPGEPSLGSRETAAGVHWTAAGENIGEGGPVTDSTTGITQMAVALTQDMLNEKPPDDGHRLNLLSSTFTHIGIAIYRGSNGTVWMTQDFSN
jgi:uncharacterized protein YkwD